MNKQVILIYDLETNKIVDVQDIRSMTPEKFAEFQKVARENRIEKAKIEKAAKEAQEAIRSKIDEDFERRITNLQKAVAHILGIKECSDEELLRCVGMDNPQTPAIDELEHPTIDEPAEIVEPNESEEEEHE